MGVVVGAHTGTDFLTVLEAGSPRSRCLAVSQPLPMAPGPTLRTCSISITSLKLPIPNIVTFWGVRTSHRNLRGHLLGALTLAPSMDSVFFDLIPPPTCPQPAPTEDH